MELAAKAVAAGICAALMALLLKKSNAELSVCLGLAAAAAILMAVLGLADELAAAAARARELSGLSPALANSLTQGRYSIRFVLLDWLGQFPGTMDCYMEDSCGWMEAAHLADLDHWILDPAAREIVRASRQPMEDLPGYIRRRGRPVQKLQSYFRDPAVQRAVLDGLPARFPEVSAACSLPGNVEITSRDATKGAALEFLCGYLGIPTARSVAFGDERNDCSMLRAAGLGIAMGNASPQARAAAGAVTASNDEDGVARAVLRLLAGERP